MQMRVLAAMILLPVMATAAQASRLLRRTSSPVYDIPQMKKIVIDGDAADWGNNGFRVDLMISPEGDLPRPADHNATFRLAWNDQGLLVLVTVQDDKWVEHEDDGWLWRYDGVEVFLTDAPGSENMCQWVISPGMTPEQNDLRWKLHDHRNDEELKKLPAELIAARRKTKAWQAGYILEISVPWSCLAIKPEIGREVGFQIYVNDADEVDGDTFHAVWYPADNTGFDSSGMYRIRLAQQADSPVQAGGSWTCVWPMESKATIYTTLALVNKQLLARVDGKTVARGIVKVAADRGMATLDMPIGLPPATESVELYVDGKRTGAALVPHLATNRGTWKIDINQIREKLLTCKLNTSPAAGLLFGPADAEIIRERAATRKITNFQILFEAGSVRVPRDPNSGPLLLTDVIRQHAEALLKTDADDVTRDFIFTRAHDARLMAMDFFFLQDKKYADWAKQRIRTLLAMDNWKHPLNDTSCPNLDYLAARVGACIAIAHDLLGDAYSEAESKQIAEVVRKTHILNFINACKGRKEWWSSEECESNWTIMTCGESGLVACHFARYWPQAEVREALAFAARGVLETLDWVPAEGDWPEGVNYWFETMGMGVRFGHALRRMTDGEVDLLQHPALKITGDFPMMLTSPSQRLYQFNDNKDSLNSMSSQTLMHLAREFDRKDWLHIARQTPVNSPLYLLLDDPAIEPEPPEKLTALFPRTGLATIRSGWGEDDTFVGLKCGPSDVGHSHLDAASFAVESKGVWLAIDPGTWPYAGQIGYYDARGPRWNWDALDTVGHSTLLIDGKGQTWGSDYPGRIVSVDSGPGWSRIVADASKTYPGVLNKFTRTVLLIGCDSIVIRDVVECEGERHAEWLLHYAGKMRDEELISIIENEGVSLAITPFLPDRSFGWRQSDADRTSFYKNQLAQDVERSIRYRSFAPFRKADKFEFLFGMRVNGESDGSDWKFEKDADGWTLKAKGYDMIVRPAEDALRVESPIGATEH